MDVIVTLALHRDIDGVANPGQGRRGWSGLAAQGRPGAGSP